MTDSDDRDRELAELRAQVARLTAEQAASPPKVEVTGGPSSAGGFRGGFFGCMGVIAAIFAVVVGIIVLSQCSKVVNQPTTSAAPTTAEAARSDAEAAAKDAEKAVAEANGQSNASAASTWTYSDESDALHDTKTHLACTTSTNLAELSPPYTSVAARLCIRRNAGGGVDVLVKLEGDGQILCGIEECSTAVRFDKGKINHFPSVGAADNSSNVIFLNRTSAFISALKRSSHTAIQLRFFQNGDQNLEFETSNLKW